jgi:hypothetical protein
VQSLSRGLIAIYTKESRVEPHLAPLFDGKLGPDAADLEIAVSAAGVENYQMPATTIRAH